MTEREHTRKKEYGEEINSAVERLIRERLGIGEDSVIWGNEKYRGQATPTTRSDFEHEAIPSVQVALTPDKNDLELCENLHLEIELKNVGKTPVLLTRVEEIVPNGFEIASHTGSADRIGNYLDLHRLRLNPAATESIGLLLRTTQKGKFIIAPRAHYMSETGNQMVSKPEPVSVRVSETILPNRIGTGFQDLDNLLLGGIPQNYAVVLSSISCDERDLLIKRYIEAGLKEDGITFYVGINAVGLRNLAEEFQSNFFVFVCNPKAAEELGELPNVFRLGGVENLTEINIGLESVLRNIEETKVQGRRVCLEILSDILLQHRAVQTRRWLSGVIPELRQRGFTTLGVINPHMHSSEEIHALLDLFEGEISLYEKETQEPAKYLRVRKMYNERYLENEIPVRKTRLMTTPLRLSCCTRTFNI